MKSIIIQIVVVIALAAMFLSALFVATRDTTDKYEWEENTYIVAKGDTLWQISCEYCPKDVDKRDWIYKVERINNMKGALIFEGQKIIILEAKTK